MSILENYQKGIISLFAIEKSIFNVCSLEHFLNFIVFNFFYFL